jgi:hypothetical protein
VVFEGTPAALVANAKKTLTGQHLAAFVALAKPPRSGV